MTKMSTSRITQSLTKIGQNIDSRFSVTSRWEASREYARSQPMRALFMASALTMVIVPVLVFLFVIGSSLAIGLTTLLLIQGAILTTSIVVLFPVIGSCIVCAAGITIFAFLAKFAFGIAVWSWNIIYGTVGTPVTNLMTTASSRFNIRSRFALPSIDCKVSKHSANGCNGQESNGQGDFPRFRARMVYTTENPAQALENED